jgi:hypothetical protein
MNPARLLAVSAAIGLSAYSASAADLRPEDAASHIGETATVCGVVASAKFEAHARAQPTLLDLGKSYPHAIFTAVIYGDHRPKFGTPETSLRGKRGKSANTPDDISIAMDELNPFPHRHKWPQKDHHEAARQIGHHHL